MGVTGARTGEGTSRAGTTAGRVGTRAGLSGVRAVPSGTRAGRVGTRAVPGPVVVAVAVAGLFAPLPSHAQTVAGRLVDGEARTPIVSGVVSLSDHTGEVFDRTVSDDDGAFRLEAPEAGEYLVSAAAVGYRSRVDGLVELAEDGYLEITFYLRPAPIALPGVTAIGERERIDRYLDGQGFYERQKMGFGYFITPEELEERMPRDTKDLLRSAPGMEVLDHGYVGQSAICNSKMGAPGDTSAIPAVFVDGIRIHFPRVGNYGRLADLDAVVGIENLAAVEVYSRPAQIPLQYAGLTGSCVILIWTKH